MIDRLTECIDTFKSSEQIYT